ncbi:MAG: hypothetical protein WC410_02655 [Candidatus Paceibacterota bacterium]|jgi:hypothetical protein
MENEEKKCGCGMPLNEKTECTCNPEVCCYCCECPPECQCGCQEKKRETG